MELSSDKKNATKESTSIIINEKIRKKQEWKDQKRGLYEAEGTFPSMDFPMESSFPKEGAGVLKDLRRSYYQ